MRLDPASQNAMLAAVSELRAFAVALCRSRDRAEDLVQEALARGIANIHLFKPGTNMTAWLITILRNHFVNECRKRRRESADLSSSLLDTMASQPEQDGRVQLAEFRAAMAMLPQDQQEAVNLVGAGGLSYEEAAEVCQCPVGTVKSRTFRGRTRLAKLLSIDSAADLGPDRAIQAALSSASLRWAA